MAPVGTELPMRIVLGVSQSPGARGRGLGRPRHSLHTDLAQESQPLAAQRRSLVGREEESTCPPYKVLSRKPGVWSGWGASAVRMRRLR